MFHKFNKPIDSIPLPTEFTCPFCYDPHLLSLMAANQVQQYIQSREDWTEELQQGKMFGVLVVKDKNGEIGFVSAFSGQIQGKNIHSYFVPPVYDLVAEDGFFKQEEAKISAINARIEELEQNTIFADYEQLQNEITKTLETEKERLRVAKTVRDEKRKQSLSEQDLQDLIRESQFQKAEFKRLQRTLQEKLQQIQNQCDTIRNEIESLSQQRKKMSHELQRRIFEHFIFLNAKGESKGALEIFGETLPPAGAGECAAPRLLQYAYSNHLQPIAMAEFWWGHSPKEHIRRQGSFYTACKQKCEPILNFMLQGLTVEENRFSQSYDLNEKITIVYEDEKLLVVDKPTNILSVPGNIPQPSVYGWAKKKYDMVYVVHRLDMATSGLLIIAKNLDVCRNLQRQFENRQVHKKYIAILDGIVQHDKGEISLPMRPDFNERPIQVVDYEQGKNAVTRYEVLQRRNGKTLVALYPQTGRTHQLRIHCAHPDGLNCPIVGDTLYGKSEKRLQLYAVEIRFTHPVNGEEITLSIEKNINFRSFLQ